MKHNLTYIILLITFFSFSQTKFEKGFFIKNNLEKVDCLIKNEDWKHNPTKFSYKLTETSQVNIATIENVKEFGINNISKYVKRKIKIDASLNHVSNLSYLKEPNWETQTVFLKVLMEGKSSLFFYTSPGLNRYFYNIDNGEIIQLIYKRYQTNDNKILTNEAYKQQLYNSFLECNSLKINDFNILSYNSVSLSKIILDYNTCLGGDTSFFEKNNKNLSFNLKVKGGINSTTVNNLVHAFISNRNANFESVLGYRIALEGEVVLPFNNNKWSVFLEFAKVQEASKETENPSGKVKYTYDSFEIPLSIRHYMYLNKDSKLSLHVGHAIDVSTNLDLEYETINGSLSSSSPSGSWFFGGGYHFKKISAEARINFKPVFERNSSAYSSNYTNLSFTLGYTIL